MPRNTETVESLFERQRGTLPDTFGLRPLSDGGADPGRDRPCAGARSRYAWPARRAHPGCSGG